MVIDWITTVNAQPLVYINYRLRWTGESFDSLFVVYIILFIVDVSHPVELTGFKRCPKHSMTFNVWKDKLLRRNISIYLSVVHSLVGIVKIGPIPINRFLYGIFHSNKYKIVWLRMNRNRNIIRRLLTVAIATYIFLESQMSCSNQITTIDNYSFYYYTQNSIIDFIYRQL